MASKEKIKALAYLRTSSAANVGTRPFVRRSQASCDCQLWDGFDRHRGRTGGGSRRGLREHRAGGRGLLYANRFRLLEFAAPVHLPALYQNRNVVRDGGLIGYSPLFSAHYPLVADYVDTILKGAKQSELPLRNRRSSNS